MDEFVLDWCVRHRTPLLDSVFSTLTMFGSEVFLIVLVAIVTGILVIIRRDTRSWMMTVLLALFSLYVMKYVVGRDRPIVSHPLIATPGSASFPSGHACMTLTIFAAIGYVVLRSRLWMIVGMGLSVLIGLSRIYLGVHYLSDVLAGWVLGLLCLWAITWTSVSTTKD